MEVSLAIHKGEVTEAIGDRWGDALQTRLGPAGTGVPKGTLAHMGTHMPTGTHICAYGEMCAHGNQYP